LGSKEIARLEKMAPAHRYEDYDKIKLGSEPRSKRWEWLGDAPALLRMTAAKVAAQKEKERLEKK
jgi:hypothetical protein